MKARLAHSFARWSRCVATPLGTLAAAAVVAAVCGFFVHRHGYVVLAAIGSTLAVGVVWPWLAVLPLRASMAFDTERGREGQASTLLLTIRSRSPLSAAGLTLTGLTEHPLPVEPVGPFGTANTHLTFVPPRRGTYPPGPVWLTCGLPFGLWHARRQVRVGRPLLAWPIATTVELPVEVRGRRQLTMAALTGSHGTGDDFHGVRPYRRGDPVKLVHHAQTARHDRLIVRELIGAARSAVRIALDSAESSYTSDGRERAIRIAAGLCAACAEAGVDADAVIEGRLARPGNSMLDALARIGRPGGPDARELLNLPACRDRGRQLVLVTSSTAELARAAASVITVEAGCA